jgi:transposase
LELRVRVVEAYESGEETFPTVAERFKVGIATAKRWVALSRKRGSVEPLPAAGGTPSEISSFELLLLISQLGDANAGELTAEFNRRRRGRRRVHVSSMKRALHRHGYVVKKNGSGRSNNSDPTSRKSGRRT